MNHAENSEVGAGPVSSHSKPCVSCRKRKVKCDKARPCSNCHRLKQLCTYDTGDSLATAQEMNPSVGNDDIRERVARLEALMATMMSRESNHSSPSSAHSQVENGQPYSGNPQTRLPNTSVKFVGGTPTGAEVGGAHGSNCTCGNAAKHYPVGLKIFQEGSSRYFDSDFWPGLVSEVS